MGNKPQVMLIVLVETARLRWFVAYVGLDGRPVFLFRSEEHDLEKYRCLEFEEQVTFLRHRFCGVLQRACDRIWALDSKAGQFVIVFDELLPDATGRLTQAFAEHLSQWMLKPPVVVCSVRGSAGADIQVDEI